MKRNNNLWLRGLCGVCVGVMAGAPVLAQPASNVLARYWQGDRAVEFSADGWTQAEGDTDQNGMDVRLSRYEAVGRWRLDPADPLSTSFALSTHRLDISSPDPALPDRLVDTSVAGSMMFAESKDTSWQVILGGGYAGDNAFGDGSAYYALAGVVMNKRLNEDSGYRVLLDYNGNRGIFPDIPLPGFLYYDRYDEQTTYTVGFPVSGVTWRPDSKTRINVNYFIPISFQGEIEHEVADQWLVFASLDSSLNAYKLDSDSNDRRLMFAQRRVEAGIVWRGRQGDSFPGVEFKIAGGYAFDQEFTRGFDVRDDDTVRDISDEPYVRFGVTARF